MFFNRTEAKIMRDTAAAEWSLHLARYLDDKGTLKPEASNDIVLIFKEVEMSVLNKRYARIHFA